MACLMWFCVPMNQPNAQMLYIEEINKKLSYQFQTSTNHVLTVSRH